MYLNGRIVSPRQSVRIVKQNAPFLEEASNNAQRIMNRALVFLEHLPW